MAGIPSFSVRKSSSTIDLKRIKIASPCPADWDRMAGDDRVRHCSECELDVYNLSAMTERDIQRLLADKQGRICGRFYRRADGTMLTQDCPTGLRAAGRRATRTVVALASALLSVGVALAKPSPPLQGTLVAKSDQRSSGSISGLVTDPQGAFISGARVTLTTLDKKKTYTATTNSNGEYRFAGLPPGGYALEVEAANFKSGKKKLFLEQRQTATVDFPMHVDGETVMVGVIGFSEEPYVETQDSGLRQTVSGRMVTDHPQRMTNGGPQPAARPQSQR